MAACIANTSSVGLSQDGLGTLRADAILNPHGSNLLKYDNAGITKAGPIVRYGWPLAGDDTYNTAVVIGPGSGPVEYGPRWAGTVAQPLAGYYVGMRVGVEVQAGYGGGINNIFSGITFDIQTSTDNVNFTSVATSFVGTPSNFTHLWHGTADIPLNFNDTATHSVWARLMVTAGALGSGDNVTAQFTRRRFIEFTY